MQKMSDPHQVSVSPRSGPHIIIILYVGAVVPEHVRSEPDGDGIERDRHTVRQHVHLAQLSTQLRHLLLHESSVSRPVPGDVLPSHRAGRRRRQRRTDDATQTFQTTGLNS